MKRRYQLPILFMVLLLTSSCAYVSNVFRRSSTDEYKAAKDEYLQLASQYETAALEGVSLCSRNKLTDVQCAKLTVTTAEVRDAKEVAKSCLVLWTKSGGRRSDKPKGCDEAAKGLRDAVGAVLVIVPDKNEKEITP